MSYTSTLFYWNNDITKLSTNTMLYLGKGTSFEKCWRCLAMRQQSPHPPWKTNPITNLKKICLRQIFISLGCFATLVVTSLKHVFQTVPFIVTSRYIVGDGTVACQVLYVGQGLGLIHNNLRTRVIMTQHQLKSWKESKIEKKDRMWKYAFLISHVTPVMTFWVSGLKVGQN